MKKTRNPVFIVELVLLFILLLFVIVTVTGTFAAARSRSLYATRLTEAVCLAQECAEVSLAAQDAKGAEELLSQMDRVKDLIADGDTITFSMTISEKSDTVYRICVERNEEPSGSGCYLAEEIRVYPGESEEAIYTLEAGGYAEGGAA